jgi:hypothetical protein
MSSDLALWPPPASSDRLLPTDYSAPPHTPRATNSNPPFHQHTRSIGKLVKAMGMTGIFKTPVRAQLTRSDAPATTAS